VIRCSNKQSITDQQQSENMTEHHKTRTFLSTFNRSQHVPARLASANMGTDDVEDSVKTPGDFWEHNTNHNNNNNNNNNNTNRSAHPFAVESE
jgi:hypothetical protein